MKASTTIYLIRHGEVYNPDEILYGRSPNYWLNNDGIEQAKAMAQVMKERPLAAIFNSPMERTRQTASFIAEHHPHLSAQIDERIHEVYTPYDGTKLRKLEEMEFDLYNGTPPQYEKPQDILKRTRDFVTQLRKDYAGREVAAVTHGDVIVFLYLFAKGAPIKVHAKGKLMDYGLPDVYPQTASINSFTYHSNDPEERPEYCYLRPYGLR